MSGWKWFWSILAGVTILTVVLTYQSYPIYIRTNLNDGDYALYQLNRDETAVITQKFRGYENVQKTSWMEIGDIFSVGGSYFRDGYRYFSYEEAKAKSDSRIKATSKELGWK